MLKLFNNKRKQKENCTVGISQDLSLEVHFIYFFWILLVNNLIQRTDIFERNLTLKTDSTESVKKRSIVNIIKFESLFWFHLLTKLYSISTSRTKLNCGNFYLFHISISYVNISLVNNSLYFVRFRKTHCIRTNSNKK